tara:strand:- start:291 stop:503 length:213 start_codon:yes stop_codon:yes gene_type:complete
MKNTSTEIYGYEVSVETEEDCTSCFIVTPKGGSASLEWAKQCGCTSDETEEDIPDEILEDIYDWAIDQGY